MDVYILDEDRRRVELIDDYREFLWAERYTNAGDFVLKVNSTRGMRQLLTPGTYLGIGASDYVMVVETPVETKDDDGDRVLEVTGRDLLSVTDRRPNMSDFGTSLWVPERVKVAEPHVIMNELFDEICRYNTIFPGDNIPNLKTGSSKSPGGIPFPTDVIEFRYKAESLFASMKRLADLYNIGFRIIKDGDTGDLYFDTYMGDNLTTLGTGAGTVIFSRELDNLTNTTYLMSNAAFRNVAYVVHALDSVIVYADGFDETVTGFDRRTMIVNAEDIELEEAGPELTAALIQRGKEELAQNRIAVAFDGEIPQNGDYIYNRDYRLGDLVEQRSAEGAVTVMRVTEQIFASDQEGDKSYPTLSIDLYVTPGAWLSAIGDWDNAAGTWASR